MNPLRYTLFFALALIIYFCSIRPDTTFYSVLVSVKPAGAGTIEPADDSSYEAGSTISLQTTPGDGNHFTGWAGDMFCWCP